MKKLLTFIMALLFLGGLTATANVTRPDKPDKVYVVKSTNISTEVTLQGQEVPYYSRCVTSATVPNWCIEPTKFKSDNFITIYYVAERQRTQKGFPITYIKPPSDRCNTILNYKYTRIGRYRHYWQAHRA